MTLREPSDPSEPCLSSFSQFGSDHKLLIHSDGFNRQGLTVEMVYPTVDTINKAAEEVNHQGQHFRRLCHHLPLAKQSREADECATWAASRLSREQRVENDHQGQVEGRGWVGGGLSGDVSVYTFVLL